MEFLWQVIIFIPTLIWNIYWWFMQLLMDILIAILDFFAWLWISFITLIFKPLDDLCVWWFGIWRDLAMALGDLLPLPEWQSAWGLESVLSMPLVGVNDWFTSLEAQIAIIA